MECHSGFTYAERPTALVGEGQQSEVRLEIEKILESSRTPQGRFYRVLAGGQAFDLIYNEDEDAWHVQAK